MEMQRVIRDALALRTKPWVKETYGEELLLQAVELQFTPLRRLGHLSRLLKHCCANT